jgi:hypothetical protein
MKKTLLGGVLALGLLSSSCLGPDNLYGSLKNWNAEVTEQDWLNEVIFVAMMVVPVYPIALLGDVLVFNTIGYWTGENPIEDPGEFPGFTRKDNK